MNATHTKGGLGKGLSALMGESYSQTINEGAATSSEANAPTGLQQLDIARIHSGAFQPRNHFDETYLHELADSIEKNGVMQPIIVRPKSGQPGHYEIIAGERRWRASKLAKVNAIPAIIREIDDQQALELALVENIQRQDLNVLEEANGYQRLMDEFSYTQETLARTVGKSRSHIANLLRLLSLPEAIKTYLANGQLSMGHARALLNAEKPEKLAKQVVEQSLSVRQTEELVRHGGVVPATTTPPIKHHAGDHAGKSGQMRSGYSRHQSKDPDILALEETLSENLGLSVSIEDIGGQRGEIIIRYESLGQLDDILRRLGDSI